MRKQFVSSRASAVSASPASHPPTTASSSRPVPTCQKCSPPLDVTDTRTGEVA